MIEGSLDMWMIYCSSTTLEQGSQTNRAVKLIRQHMKHALAYTRRSEENGTHSPQKQPTNNTTSLTETTCLLSAILRRMVHDHCPWLRVTHLRLLHVCGW